MIFEVDGSVFYCFEYYRENGSGDGRGHGNGYGVYIGTSERSRGLNNYLFGEFCSDTEVEPDPGIASGGGFIDGTGKS